MTQLLNLRSGRASIHVPDETPLPDALRRVTHLGIGAHPDDLEIMSFHAIEKCLRSADEYFGGVVITTGAGGPRAGQYLDVTDDAFAAIRRFEQQKASTLGRYAVTIQLGYDSKDLKGARSEDVADDLTEILRATFPRALYLHNPFDRHPTHVAACSRAIVALRRAGIHPSELYGCEVWGGLDWLDPADTIPLDCSRNVDLARALLAVYDSQIASGKRYDEATIARWRSNATYRDSYGVDTATHIALAVDLHPLLEDPGLALDAFVARSLDRHRDRVLRRLIHTRRQPPEPT